MSPAEKIVARAIDAAGQAGGLDEVEAIAAKGPGEMVFSDEDMVVLVAEYGTPADAMYEIQLEAQRRVSMASIEENEEVSP